MDDLIRRQDAIDGVNSETVSTNPEHFKSSEKFIKFMDDADIASFGKWQWANGFNTALVATTIQLKKLSSAQQWTPCSEGLPEEDGAYLCWEWQGFYYVDSFKDGNWNLSNKVNAKCIAWMPLPAPYKEE